MSADGRVLRTLMDFESLMLDLEAGESLSLDIDDERTRLPWWPRSCPPSQPIG